MSANSYGPSDEDDVNARALKRMLKRDLSITDSDEVNQLLHAVLDDRADGEPQTAQVPPERSDLFFDSPFLDEMAAQKGGKTWACKKCGFILNIFGDTSGNRAFIHTRNWMKHDHEPEPVLVDLHTPLAKGICDFCSNSENLNWSLSGKHVRLAPSPGENVARDYGTDWAACDICDALITAGDIEGVIDRIIENHPGFEPHSLQGLREAYRVLHGQFIPSIHTRTRITPLPPPALMPPRKIPRIRDSVIKFWSDPDNYAALRASTNVMSLPGLAYGEEEHFKLTGPGTEHSESAFTEHAKHLVAGLYVSELYYISRDFTTKAIIAGKELADLSVTREELPAPFGFLMWEEPVFEVGRLDGFTAGIRTVSWTLVPGGVWINSYIQPEDGDVDYRSISRETHGWLIGLNPGSGIPFGNLGTIPPDTPGAELFQTLLATWFLITQPGIGQEDIQHPDKGVQRAYKRAGRKPPIVRLIDIRRRSQAQSEAVASARDGRALTNRVRVRGHWKRQAYGPGYSLRKTIHVEAYHKGPEGAPFKPPAPTVKVLR